VKNYHGQPVCNGFAMGEAILYRHKVNKPVRVQIRDAEAELERLNKAKLMAGEQLECLRQKALQELGKDQAMIFESHAMILQDAEFEQSVADLIRRESINAEYAVAEAAKEYASFFESMGDPFLAERGADVNDVADRWISCLGVLSSTSPLSSLAEMISKDKTNDQKGILCAEDLSPSEALSLDADCVSAILLAYGSATSHASILARSKNIPAIIGMGPDFLNALSDGTYLLVDADAGEVTLNPSAEERQACQEKLAASRHQAELLQKLKSQESITLDGTRIEICANAGSAEDAATALENGAEGIGLFRSEFLYLKSKDYPSEETQYQAYREILECMAGKKVIIRTLDVGADKQIDYFHLDKEENPALGMRAIRLCLTRPELFKTQLRALYRASVHGRLGIMFPMIASVSEVKKILAICEEVKGELRGEGIAFAENIEIGIMIETPAAAILSDKLAPLVDFFSVGTNDLTQYALAMDRQNAKLDPFRDEDHEAVLRLIRMAADNAHKNGAWIGICGELAADPTLTETFLKMGIDELSVSTPFILPLRSAVRSLNLK